MSKYTTGEIAKICSVSVRTVQYYDSREILVPTELSEGGRRIYSEDDLRRMKIICFLRELDLPINSIRELLLEEHADDIITTLLGNKEKVLRMEIAQREERLGKILELKKCLKKVKNLSAETIRDISHIMEYKKKLRKVRTVIIGVGIVMDIIRSMDYHFLDSNRYLVALCYKYVYSCIDVHSSLPILLQNSILYLSTVSHNV